MLKTPIQKINELGLNKKLIVIGTNSLFAYEARAGVNIEEEHLATDDIDILNRKEKGLSFIFTELVSPTNTLSRSTTPVVERSWE